MPQTNNRIFGCHDIIPNAVCIKQGSSMSVKKMKHFAGFHGNAANDVYKTLFTEVTERHENIVRVYEILDSSDGYVYIIMEAARNGDMLRYVQRKGALPESEVRKYFYELTKAIKYCHSMNICHRDLKCENLLLDKENKLLLTDFGFSKSMMFNNGDIVKSTTFCGSAAYAAPEIIRGHPYDPRMHDIWSMGVILYIMACGHMPFDDSNVKRMLKVQLKNNIKFPPRVADTLSDEIKDLIRRLIQPDVRRRITVDDILRHSFFKPKQTERPNSGNNPVVNVTQHIYDFFTGRPSSSQNQRSSPETVTSASYDEERPQCSSRRQSSGGGGGQCCSHRHGTRRSPEQTSRGCSGSVSSPVPGADRRPRDGHKRMKK